MSCCTGRRSAVANHNAIRAAVIGEQRQHISRPDNEATLLLYTGPNGLSVRGPVSGQVYQPGRKGLRVNVDTRDVPAFLRAGLFENT